MRSARPDSTRLPRRSTTARRTSGLLVALVVLASIASGCVGRRGRNDDVVAPGSEGRLRIEVPARIDESPAGAERRATPAT